ncbi:hypothetical protein JTE90_005412 [Oedothorax gibbosus]|uniref:Uncharacterized protein n=1 Tax=Oedothorax gibbosus TaxID=931172 RepID=A0AAV6TIV0_9ARAC|nr:hypothetical protein JTE90_005412 [Oedothorax gibbosus]
MMSTLLFFLILGCVQELNSREIGRVKREYSTTPCREGNTCLLPDESTPVITDDGRCVCRFNNEKCSPENTCLDPDYRAVLYRRNPESDFYYCTCVLSPGKGKSKKDCKLKRALGAYLVRNLNGKDLEECEDEEDGEEEFSRKIVPNAPKPRRNEPQSPCTIRKFFNFLSC